MNIDDVEYSKLPEGNLIQAIFLLQEQLAEKYSPIERRNGFYYPEMSPPPHIDDGQFQYWIKGMFWRATEEIAEALEKVPDLEGNWHERWETDSDLRHFFEELADALHFITEVSLVSGFSWQHAHRAWCNGIDAHMGTHPNPGKHKGDRNPWSVSGVLASPVWAMGLAANTLKNKPWKSTQMPTDEAKFRSNVGIIWYQFAKVWAYLGCDLTHVYTLYAKKHAVNVFRQDSNY